jgi:hypothetical protein
MAKTYSQSDILTTLAYLLGERTVNATTSAPRADFIQQTLEEAYASYPWRFSRGNATLVISNLVATLPTNYDVSQESHIKFGTSSEITIDEVNEYDSEQIVNGDRAAWIYAVGDDQYVLRLRDTDVTAVDFKYHKKAPVLDSAGTVVTPYPNKMTIALGARRYVKLGQNPDADISQDEKIFQNKLSADIAFHQVPSPRKRRKTAQTQAGRATGDW